MKIKKIVSMVLAVILILGLTACSNGTETEESKAEESKTEESKTEETEKAESSSIAEEQVELRFMWWGSDTRHEATMAVIEQYEAEHPNVKITAEYSGYDGYFEKLTTQLAGNTSADIIQYDASMTTDLLSIGDVFIDLNDYTDILDISDFDMEFVKNFGEYGGSLVGLPTGINAGNFLINTAVTEAVGIDVTIPYTWDKLIEDGKKLREYDSEQYFLNYDITTLGKEFIFSVMAQLTGEEILDLDTYTLNFTRDDLYKVFSLIDSLYKEEVLEPAADSVPFDTQINTNPKWISHDYAATFGITSFTTGDYYTFKDTAVVVNMPEFEDAKENGVIYRPSQLIGIAETCKYPEIAADFLNYFYNSDEAARTLKDCRSIPPTVNARAICEAEGLIEPIVVQSVELAAKVATDHQNLSVPNDIVEILKDATAKIAYSQGTVDEITDETMDLLGEALGRLK